MARQIVRCEGQNSEILTLREQEMFRHLANGNRGGSSQPTTFRLNAGEV
jgi:hypothetical protein